MDFANKTQLDNLITEVHLNIGNEPNEEGPLAAIALAQEMIHDGADPFTLVSVSWGPIHLDAFNPEELTLGRLAFAF